MFVELRPKVFENYCPKGGDCREDIAATPVDWFEEGDLVFDYVG